jgi:hypothetical protein
VDHAQVVKPHHCFVKLVIHDDARPACVSFGTMKVKEGWVLTTFEGKKDVWRKQWEAMMVYADLLLFFFSSWEGEDGMGDGKAFCGQRAVALTTP